MILKKWRGGLGERGCQILAERRLADIYPGAFLSFLLLVFFGVVFRESWDAFFGFRVPLGVSRGVSRTSFLEEFREFPNFGGGSKSMAGAMF